MRRRAEPSQELDTPVANRRLIEAVVSSRCPLVGTSIREGEFRSYYNAAVVAVARGGERLRGKIGDIVLEPGDTLLLETDEDFLLRQRNSSHFFLVSGVDNSQPVRRDRAWVALGAVGRAWSPVATLGWLNLLHRRLHRRRLDARRGLLLGEPGPAERRLVAAGRDCRGAGRWQVDRIERAGRRRGRRALSAWPGGHPWWVLVAVYFVTMVFTELVTNNAAAVLIYPIAMASAHSLKADAMPFIIAIAIGASAGFATPFGYQTNLMVYGPGGYRFTDYFRVGIPLDLVFMAVTVALTPFVFPFHP